MTDSISDQAGEWYVTTGIAQTGGVRIAGPFPAKNDAILARNPIEEDRGSNDLWVLDASDLDCPAANPGES